MKIEIQNEINIYIFKYFKDWDISYKAKEDLGNLISLAITKTKVEMRDGLNILIEEAKNNNDGSDSGYTRFYGFQDCYQQAKDLLN